METIELHVNGEIRQAVVKPATPLLWVLRDHLKLTGTKFGCGKGLCGACTVHLDGEAVRSCSISIEAAAGARITTIEGVSRDPTNRLIRAWVEKRVSQCGYCQPGQIMTAAALLASRPRVTEADVRSAMTNLCRCGTYQRILDAVLMASRGGSDARIEKG